ncbi:MAG: type II secretion system protein [Planctomycetota bacterium]
MSAQSRRLPRAGFTLIELLVVIAVIIILATIAITALAGVQGQQKIKDTTATLKIIDSSIHSYYELYGRWPIDNTVGPPSPPGPTEAAVNLYANGELNKNILKNLEHDWGQGNFSAFPPNATAIDPGDGSLQFVDAWGRPYVFKIKTISKQAKQFVQVIYYYSVGADGLDDWASFQTWLNGASGVWPPPDSYQDGLTSLDPNKDDVYPGTD